MQKTDQGHLLITGGAGFIGSHMCVEALQAGYSLTVVDNLSNSSRAAIEAVERITQRSLRFVEGDVRDQALFTELMSRQTFAGVVHFAGLKAVGESNTEPLRYWDNNVRGTASLLQAMQDTGHRTLVFSSSATVYGETETMPLTEDAPTGATNPYGQTKLTVEHLLKDLQGSAGDWRISILRYFNPIGAHASGEIGEDPNDVPNNLMPFVSQVAVGRREKLAVFGNDYPTPDGTGVRDYIHVVDLVRGHLKALEFLSENPGLHVHNLGTGHGSSVLEVVKAFEKASGQTVPYEIVDRRPGDAAVSYADPAKAERDLGWVAEYDLDTMCRDAWHWQSKHPQGFTPSD
ncbi:MAG: UDP-glucose 4-epimerase GalE [Pseudomonadota bacterium]